jgi:hypothetical protein
MPEDRFRAPPTHQHARAGPRPGDIVIVVPTAKKTPAKKAASKTTLDELIGSRVQLAANLEYYHAKEWKTVVENYERDPSDFFSAYEFLRLHPANIRRFATSTLAGTPETWFEENLRIMVVKVDPKTKRIATKANPGWKTNGKGKRPIDSARNTETNVWLEWGPYIEAPEFPTDTPTTGGSTSHDPRTDTGAATFELAIVNLANNVYHLYGGHSRIPHDKKLPKKLYK